MLFLLLINVAVATIHGDHRVAFQSAAQRLPEELEDRIWEYYPKIDHGDNPKSSILSLEETQALFPPLNLLPVIQWDSYVTYVSLSALIMPSDRYLTLHVTDKQTEYDDMLIFRFGHGCPGDLRYVVMNDTVEQWDDRSDFEYIGSMRKFQVDKRILNWDLEPGTAVLLHIPRQCTLLSFSRSFEFPVHNFNRQVHFPETIRLSDEVPLDCRWLSIWARVLRFLRELIGE